MTSEPQFYLHAGVALGLFVCVVVMWEALARVIP